MKQIKLAYFDFDGCLAATPLAEEGKLQWSKHYNMEYPHIGWWGRHESMDPDVFNIKTHRHIHNEYTRLIADGFTSFILTSRQPKFKEHIQNILNNNNVVVDDIFLAKGKITKGERVLAKVKEYISNGYIVTDVIFFDDRNKEIITAEDVKDEMLSMGINFKIIKVESDTID